MSRRPYQLGKRRDQVDEVRQRVVSAARDSFAQAGAAVALASRDEAALEGVASEIRDEGGTALVVPTDVSDHDAMASLVEAVLVQFGRLDFACNNAAGGGAIVNTSSTAGLQAVGGLAAVVVWLCSEEAAYITGSTVVIDGGKLAGTPPFQVQLSPRT